MDCSTLGLPVYHQLPKFTQTHVYWVSDAIQPSHLLSGHCTKVILNQLKVSRIWVLSCSACRLTILIDLLSFRTLPFQNPYPTSTPKFPVLHFLKYLLIYFWLHWVFFFFSPFFLNFILFFKLYIIVLVLPNIKMNPPQVYMCTGSLN